MPYTKSAVSESLIALVRLIEFNFLTAWTIAMKLGTLGHHVPGYKVASNFLIFAQGLSYGLSKSKKLGKIITEL